VSQRRALLQAEFERNLTHRRRVSILTALSRGTAALQLLTGGGSGDGGDGDSGGGSSAAAAAVPDPEGADAHLEAFQAECWAVTRTLCACGAPGADTAGACAAGTTNGSCSGVSDGGTEADGGAGGAATWQCRASEGALAGLPERQGSSTGASAPLPSLQSMQWQPQQRSHVPQARHGAGAATREPDGPREVACDGSCAAAHWLGVTPREFLERWGPQGRMCVGRSRPGGPGAAGPRDGQAPRAGAPGSAPRAPWLLLTRRPPAPPAPAASSTCEPLLPP
jgi:hypothetical protein